MHKQYEIHVSASISMTLVFSFVIVWKLETVCLEFSLYCRVDELTKQYSSLEDEFRQALQIESSRFQQVSILP